jgi:hypothetical protein
MPVFEQTKLPREKLQLSKSPLVGFAGDKVYLFSAIILLVTTGSAPKHVIIVVSFKLLASTRIVCNIVYMQVRGQIHRKLCCEN